MYRQEIVDSPSTLTPHLGMVYQVNPERLSDGNRPIIYGNDFYQFDTSQLCVVISENTEDLLLHVAVGTMKGLESDDVSPFSSAALDDFVCQKNLTLQHLQRYYMSLKAAGPGGISTEQTKGITVINEDQLNLILAKDGHGCRTALQVGFITIKDEFTSNGSRLVVLLANMSTGIDYTIVVTGTLDLSNLTLRVLEHSYAKQVFSNELTVQYISFIALRKQVSLELQSDEIPPAALSGLIVSLKECSENVNYQLSTTDIEAHLLGPGNLLAQITHLECAVIEKSANCPNLATCIDPPFINYYETFASKLFCSFRKLKLLQGQSYAVGVRPCFQNICSNTIYTPGTLVVPESVPVEITYANGNFLENSNDIYIDASVVVDTVNLGGHDLISLQWSLSRTSDNSHLLFSWHGITESTAETTIVKVNIINALDEIYLFKTSKYKL